MDEAGTIGNTNQRKIEQPRAEYIHTKSNHTMGAVENILVVSCAPQIGMQCQQHIANTIDFLILSRVMSCV